MGDGEECYVLRMIEGKRWIEGKRCWVGGLENEVIGSRTMPLEATSNQF